MNHGETSAGDERSPIQRIETTQARYSIGQLDEIMTVCEHIALAVEALIESHAIFPAGAPRHAYVSYATPDYRWGLIVWLRSLRQVSQKPVLLLVSRPLLIPAGIDGVYQLQVPGLHDPQFSFDRAEFQNVLSKFWAFALTPLSRVLFVDVDCVITQSVDHLFDRSEFLVCPDYVETRSSNRFNSGVLIFNPTPALRDRVFATAQGVTSYDGGDQGALNIILADEVTFLDERYNLLRHFYYFSGRKDLSDVHIVHYIVKKPWELQYRETPDGFLIELDDLWTSFLTRAELLALVSDWRRSIFRVSERARIESLRAPPPEALRHSFPQGFQATVRRQWHKGSYHGILLAAAAAALAALLVRSLG